MASRAPARPARVSRPAAPTGRLGRVVEAVSGAAARRPKRTIAAWLVLVVALVALGAATGTRTLSGAVSGTGQSQRAFTRIAAAGLAAPPTEQVLVGSASAVTTAEVVAQLEGRLVALPGVAAVTGPAAVPQLGTDGGRTALVQVTLRGTGTDAGTTATTVAAVVAQVAAAHPPVRFRQAGEGSADNAVSDVLGVDLRRAELVSLPITLLVLLIAFGSLVAAAVPLLLGLTCVAAAIGALGPVSQVFPTSSSASTLVVLIGLAVGVDYSLFLIRRERVERRAGAGPDAALRGAVAGTSRAVVVAGLTVMAALGGLLLTGMALFESLAVATVLVVAMAVVESVTVLPAALALLGDRIGAGRLRLPRALAARLRRRSRGSRAAAPSASGATGATGATTASGWGRVGAVVSSHPFAALVGSVAVLAAITVPALGLRTTDGGVDDLPTSVPVVAAVHAIERAFPGAASDAELVVEGARLSSPGSRRALQQLGALGTATTGGRGATSVRVAADGATAVVSVPMPDSGPAAGRIVQALRAATGSEVGDRPGLDALAGSTVLVTGDAAQSADFAGRLSSRTPVAVGAVLVVAFVLLLLAFGSVPLALAVVALDLLSVGAAYGILAAVFQHSWAAGMLDFTPTGAVVDWIPLFAFVILFGLAMDYTVIVLERVREGRAHGLSPRVAAAEGVGATGGTVTAAAVVMFAVFAVLATLRLVEFKQLGVGLAASIALDATLVRGVALPAAVCLLGRRGWRVRPSLPVRHAAPAAGQ